MDCGRARVELGSVFTSNLANGRVRCRRKEGVSLAVSVCRELDNRSVSTPSRYQFSRKESRALLREKFH